MLFAGGLTVLAVGGCGEKKIDDEKVEDHIREQARVPQAIQEITCPDDREAKEGDTFECEILAEDGSKEAVTIRQEDDDGTIVITGNRQTELPEDKSNLEIVPENVEDLIRGAAPERERIVSVDCPAGIGLQKGRKFDCVVRFDDSSEEFVEITQRDDLGNVEITGTRERKNP